MRSEPTEAQTGGARRVRLILHGKQAGHAELRSAVATLRAEGYPIEVRVTWEAGDALLLTCEAVQAGVATVAAAGGDGTINEVVRGLLEAPGQAERPVALGIVPLGTANDFARSVGIPADPLGALRLILNEPARPVDLGQVGEHAWINMATGGFGAQITVATPEEAKRVLGGAAYLLTGLTQFSALRTDHGTFRGPGFEWSGEFLVLAIGNGRQAGGGHVLCPNALINDGFFDVSILPVIPNTEIGGVLNGLLTQGMGALASAMVSARVDWLEIDAPSGLNINLDGEPISGTQLRFTVLPSRLPVHLPSDTPLLG